MKKAKLLCHEDIQEAMKDRTAVVVLSGGQDSVTCLGWAVKMYAEVHCIGFKYGQKHEIELEQARKICMSMGVSFNVHSIPSLKHLGDSALTTKGDVNTQHHRNENLPASFVPNRNALFLTIAHAYAQRIGAGDIVTGVCQTDYSGYPDCRNEFVTQLEKTLNIGYETNIRIQTPLMYLTKAETFALAEECEVLDTVIEHSHTCYNGNRETRNEWGYGCGGCPACELRARGYEEYKWYKEADNA